MDEVFKQIADRPAVSVIIPCRNESRHIKACVSSILSQVEPEGGFEVIVADGMSEDGSREILSRIGQEIRHSSEKDHPSNNCDMTGPAAKDQGGAEPWRSARVAFPRLRVIDNPGRIASTGLNAAIKAAQGRIIIRMDAHTDYAPDYLQRCVRTLRETGADNVGGPARTRTETYLERVIGAAYHSSFSVGGARFHDVNFEGPVDTVTYGCWPRSTFEKFGLFDEELVRNQDDEHNLRITRKGGKVWQSPAIRSWYRPRGSLKALFEQYMQYGYWKVLVIQKNKLPASWRHLVPGAFLLVLSLLLLAGAGCLLLSALRVLPRALPNLPLVAFSSLLSLYVLALLMVSMFTASRTEWRLAPVLPLAFGCYHFGYGFGFLRGVWDFIIRSNRPQPGFERLTR
jgi:glycosyltransferase involved in cell wall biosynthesis